MITYNRIPDNPHSKKGDFSLDPDSEEIIPTEQSVAPSPQFQQAEVPLTSPLSSEQSGQNGACAMHKLDPLPKKKKEKKRNSYFLVSLSFLFLT